MGLLKRLLYRKAAVVTVQHRSQAPIDEGFRLPGDPPYRIRLVQRWPEGLGESLVPNVSVLAAEAAQAGMLGEMIDYGSERRIELIREGDSSGDSNAIKVMGYWSDPRGGQRGAHIGYIPRDVAAQLAQQHGRVKLGARILSMYRSRSGMPPGVELDIGGPKG